MIDLIKFKQNAISYGLCGEYRRKWDNATSQEDLLNIALDPNGVEMLSDASAFGWGMDVLYMKRTFSRYINGLWKRDKDGYTSSLYVDFNGAITKLCTLTTIIASNVDIYVPKGFVGKIYISGGSSVHVSGEGICYICSYGENNIKGNFERMTILHTSTWKPKASEEANKIEDNANILSLDANK